jgi:hypothetical protein
VIKRTSVIQVSSSVYPAAPKHHIFGCIRLQFIAFPTSVMDCWLADTRNVNETTAMHMPQMVVYFGNVSVYCMFLKFGFKEHLFIPFTLLSSMV